MIIQNIFPKQLIVAFPLGQICSQWEGYFIDSDGNIYSSRQTKAINTVKKLIGQRVQSRSHRYYTLSNVTFRSDKVLAQAKRASTWGSETDPKQLGAASKVKDACAIESGKTQDVLQAVKGRGFVIASITEGKLTFGAEPKIHSTKKSVDKELARLAKLMPGTVFVRLHIISAAVAGLTYL